ncbi:hypothetical protein ACFYYM_37980 [Streptomyces erythrochromogenes]|uniref:hypothetical protein n=1 Tax=Streptomyces erythrochromogenes TaxID=285574 RepID=UPI003674FDE5
MLGLPVGDQRSEAQELRAPVQVQEVEQSVGVHGRHAMQVRQEVPLIGGDEVQGQQEYPARVLVRRVPRRR